MYMLQSDDRWLARCLTPCVLVVPVGGITIATVPTGANSVTLSVPDDGLSVEVPIPSRTVFQPTLPARVVRQSPSVIDWGGPIRTNNTGTSALSVTGIAIAVTGGALSAIFFAAWLGSIRSSGFLMLASSDGWLGASGVAILGVPVGALMAWAGSSPPVAAHPRTNRFTFAPTIVPTFTFATHGIALVGQF